MKVITVSLSFIQFIQQTFGAFSFCFQQRLAICTIIVNQQRVVQKLDTRAIYFSVCIIIGIKFTFK